MGLLNLLKRKKLDISQKKSKPQKLFIPKVRAGLALGGGGARGFAHLGVLKAFDENDIDFPIVTGTSVGSLIGSLYSYGVSLEDMIELAKTINEKEIRSSKFFFRPSPAKNIETLVNKIYGDIQFSDLNKKFALSTVDIRSGEEVVLKEGHLAKAVSASCAVPLIFSPVEWEDYRLVDGGLANVIPSDIARQLGAEIVISVDLNSTRGGGTDSLKTLDIFFAVFRIAMKSAAVKGILNSDIIIKPDLKAFKSTKIDNMTEMIDEGYRATMEAMPQIKELLGYKN